MKYAYGAEIKNKRLSSLEELLKEWTVVIEDFCNHLGDDDAPYWYNERTTLGTFAGAIWRAKGLALEEYGDTKKYRKQRWEGRVDLYFSLNEEHYVVEAKQKWLFLNVNKTSKNIKDEADRPLQQAIGDVKSDALHGGCPLGILFIVPIIRKDQLNRADGLLQTFFEGIGMVDYDMLAWQFPDIARNLDYNNAIYPGIVLLAKTLKTNK